MKTLFAWDFHGVLEKDNELSVKRICDTILKQKGFDKEISMEKVKELYGLRWYDYFKYLMPSASHEELMGIVEQAIFLSGEMTKKFLKPNDHALTVLQGIKDKGHHSIVISNSSPERIKDFVSWVKLDSFVDKSIGIDKHRKDLSFDLVKEKAKVIKEHAKKIGALKIVVIGDREEDVLAGLKCRAVAYLYKGPLSKDFETKAHHQIFDLREVLKEI